jgi:hypothetical protein
VLGPSRVLEAPILAAGSVAHSIGSEQTARCEMCAIYKYLVALLVRFARAARFLRMLIVEPGGGYNSSLPRGAEGLRIFFARKIETHGSLMSPCVKGSQTDFEFGR